MFKWLLSGPKTPIHKTLSSKVFINLFSKQLNPNPVNFWTDANPITVSWALGRKKTAEMR